MCGNRTYLFTALFCAWLFFLFFHYKKNILLVFTRCSHHFLGAANPTVARRNMTLPGENGQNLVEWRFRKEQTRGKVIVFGRKLRVSALFHKQTTIESFITGWRPKVEEEKGLA